MTGEPIPHPPPAGHAAIFQAAEPDYVSVYVEGPSDVVAWKSWLRWKPIAASGRSDVLEKVKTVKRSGQPGLGIADADFDHLEGTVLAEDILVTGNHDLETDLICSSIFDRLLNEVDETALVKLTGNARSFRECLLERAKPFGLVRWWFHRARTEFPLKRLNPYRFTNPATWSVDTAGLLQEAAALRKIDADAAQQEIDLLSGTAPNPGLVCNGHDLLALLTLALKGPLGCSLFPNAEAVSAALRLTMSMEHLPELAVWQGLGKWEHRNVPRRVRRT